jgi:hypothetical protein
VVDIAEKLAEVATERNIAIEIDSRVLSKAKRARVTPELAPMFAVRHASTRRHRTARGELIAIDLRTGRVDVEDVAGRRVQCRFDPDATDLMERVKQLVGQVVLVAGDEEYDQTTKKAGRLDVRTIEGTAEAIPLDGDFWRNEAATHQALRQQVGPIASVSDIASTEPIADDEFDSFLKAIQEARKSE